MQGQQLRLREEAVTAASKLFEEEHFSLENLALELGCSLRDLNASIVSVDQLVIEVNSRTLDRLLASVSREAALTGTPEENVQTLCRVFLGHCQKHKPFIDLLFLHPFPEDFERPDWYLQQVGACFRPLENALGILKPTASPADRAQAARAVWSQVLGVFFLLDHGRLTPVGIQSQEGLVRYSIEVFLKGWVR